MESSIQFYYDNKMQMTLRYYRKLFMNTIRVKNNETKHGKVKSM